MGYTFGSALPSCQSKQRNTICYTIPCASMKRPFQLLRRSMAFFLLVRPEKKVSYGAHRGDLACCGEWGLQPWSPHPCSTWRFPSGLSGRYMLSNNLSQNLHERTRVKQSCPVQRGRGSELFAFPSCGDLSSTSAWKPLWYLALYGLFVYLSRGWCQSAVP